MTVSSTAGIAQAWAATRADAQSQALSLAMLKQQSDGEKTLVAMLDAAAQSAPPPLSGQGQQVDRRV
jgi:hypothetical protein